ncbi:MULTISPECIES: ribosome maturation factor RimP [Amycolatopsis]|uniref:Ribosome maturation factor RimP n=1 Tax=Amycolatopsis albidoflavus TaxID=102226 RepID=A0ABW5I364_9PSEU
MPNELASRLEPIVAEAVTTAGFDLDSLEVQQAGRRQLVKVVVDSDDGVGLDEVAEVSRTVSAALDENEHVLASAYTLEVTSPGLDRPLTQQRHWRRARFRLVKITPVEGAAYLARVGHAGEKSVRALVDGRIKDVHYQSVAKAVVEVEFKQPPAEDLKQLTEDGAAEGDKDKKEESK